MINIKNQQSVYEGLICKFILNLPSHEKEDICRLSFHAEKAFYHFFDQVIHSKDQVRANMEVIRNEFFAKLKMYSPNFLKINPSAIIAKLQENKPVCGAIIFNIPKTKILVVRVGNKFGFPKGKWNQQEEAQQCAARQVYEETGIQIHTNIDPSIRIQFERHGAQSIFFVARGISEDGRIKIDKHQVDDVFWMWTTDIVKYISKFVERSRVAWQIYQNQYQNGSKFSIQKFIEKYKSVESNHLKPQVDLHLNPLLNFKFNHQKLMQALWS